MIKLMSGNLLEDNAEALVNTVNTKGIMGKGIALQFKQAYPDMYAKYEFDCKNEKISLGKIHIYDNGSLGGGPKWILNFPTKNHWKSKSKLEDIESGLDNLAEVIEELKISSIAIPPLGCGLGGLKWETVLPVIERKLSNIKSLTVHIYPPAGAPKASTITVNTKEPKITKSTAALILLIDRYIGGKLTPLISLLEVHKLMYFLQESGESLKLNFERKPYGPFAKNLRHMFIRMDGHLIEGYGDGYDAPKKLLKLKPGAVEKAENYLTEEPALIEKLENVAHLIEGFEDPYGLELLSTVHWVANQEVKGESLKTEDEVIAKVQAWSQRKKRIMKPAHLAKAHEHLKRQHMLH